MHSFTDLAGRKWEISIKVGEIKAIQAATQIDFAKPENFGKLTQDTLTSASILWALIRKQAEKLELTEEQVWDGFDDVVVCEAIVAVSEELLLFFRNPPHLMKLKAAMEDRAKAVQTAAGEKVEQLIEKVTTGALDKFIQDPSQLDKLLAGSTTATDSPASSASTPSA